MVKRRLREKEKNGNSGLEPFNVTLVTVEELDSSNVTLVNLNATLVTLENLESSDVTLVSEDKDIIGTNLGSEKKVWTKIEKRSIGEIQLLQELWIEDDTELATIDDDTEVTSIEEDTELATTEDDTELATIEDDTELATIEDDTELATIEDDTELATIDDDTELATIEDESLVTEVKNIMGAHCLIICGFFVGFNFKYNLETLCFPLKVTFQPKLTTS